MHMRGLAADILCPQFGLPLEVCRAIVAAGIVTDQIIHEFGRWCHVAFPAPGIDGMVSEIERGYLDDSSR